MAALDEVYGLCTEKMSDVRAAEALTEIERLNEKYNIRPDMLYSPFDTVTPDGSSYYDRMYHKFTYLLQLKPDAAYEYLDMIMRNLSFFDGLHDEFCGKGKVDHEYKNFTVNTHDFIYHGTPLKNFKTIIEQGEICRTDYSIIQNPADFDPGNFDSNRAGTGMVYVTDNIDIAAKYALKEREGVILCLDLFGHTLKIDAKNNSGNREIMSDDTISIDCLRKAYRIYIEKNRVHLEEMEVKR